MNSDLRYRQLDKDNITATIERLRNRINERFPESGLGRVAAELLQIGQETTALSEYLARPNWAIRSATILGWTGIAATLGYVATTVVNLDTNIGGVAEFFQGADAAMSMLVFLGGSVFFLGTLETRIKRSKVLPALHQLRSVAHIVDMHQLTKDPEHLAIPSSATASSPQRLMNPTELGRYLDYCSEMLSLVSKIAALHVQHFNDSVVLEAVTDIEQLSNSLSNKIWQKITLLERVVRE